MTRVLFLCTGNSCRSQMAEGWLKQLGKGHFQAFSAGTAPVGINPLAIKAMAEAGVDISTQQSEKVDSYLGQPFDHVITLCGEAAESCPLFTGKVGKKDHWPLPDPAAAKGSEEERMVEFRKVRDEIRRRVMDLIASGGNG